MIKQFARRYFASLYSRTMDLAYQQAYELVSQSLGNGGDLLDCGTGAGGHLSIIRRQLGLDTARCFGIEWDPELAGRAAEQGYSVVRGDLNASLPFDENRFQCVCALSVLEHLTRGCLFMQEVRRVLKPGGSLVLLTPNLSAWFNVFLLALGKMPSSGPHPDSSILMQNMEPVSFREVGERRIEDPMPTDRHLVVFSYRVLRKYLSILEFRDIQSYGYGVYPFPGFAQPLLERLDPWHTHQLVFSATK